MSSHLRVCVCVCVPAFHRRYSHLSFLLEALTNKLAPHQPPAPVIPKAHSDLRRLHLLETGPVPSAGAGGRTQDWVAPPHSSLYLNAGEHLQLPEPGRLSPVEVAGEQRAHDARHHDRNRLCACALRWLVCKMFGWSTTNSEFQLSGPTSGVASLLFQSSSSRTNSEACGEKRGP